MHRLYEVTRKTSAIGLDWIGNNDDRASEGRLSELLRRTLQWGL